MNIEAAKAVADAIRTSLGPRGMDKMVGAWLAVPGSSLPPQALSPALACLRPPQSGRPASAH